MVWVCCENWRVFGRLGDLRVGKVEGMERVGVLDE